MDSTIRTAHAPLILAPGETEFASTGLIRAGGVHIYAGDERVQRQRRIGWDARQAEVDELRKRVAELEAETREWREWWILGKVPTGEHERSKAEGYAACEADVVAYVDQWSDVELDATDWATKIERGEHRGAAARKDGDL